MTRDDYIKWAGADRAEIEAAAASGNMTGQELVELLIASAMQTLEENGLQPAAPRNAVVAQVSGNVIQVNFSARAEASWTDRKARQEPSKRPQLANRVSLMPITVPSTAPAKSSSKAPSTSLDTVIPYSSC